MSTEPDLFQRFEDYLRYELDASPRTVSSYSRDLERYRRYAEERLMHYIDEAKQLILHYPESTYRQSLLALADYIAARSY